ncbi:MAG: zinc-binding dehydrogenase [Bacteroidales bacterium]|nr:zinc-binding dehydrogenase [Bacteroidales bacterium]
MKAILLEQYNSNLIELIKNLNVSNIDKPIAGDNQVLIKMKYATCNPSDIAFMRGMYNVKKNLPKALGFEGCGIVVEAGKSKDAQNLLGKRVSCFVQGDHHGTWAEFVIAKPENCIVLVDEISDQQAACLFVNPFTAYALFQIAKENKAHSILLNAGLSQVASFIRSFAKTHGIKVINIVRRDNHVELLKQQGCKYAISSRSKTYSEDLENILNLEKPSVFFDAVGGEATGQIINLLPENAKTIVYGGLSGDPIGGIDVLDIIFKNKQILGFDLNKFIKNTERKTFDELSLKLQEQIVNGDISTLIQKISTAEEVALAIRQYITRMSDGKILFTFE